MENFHMKNHITNTKWTIKDNKQKNNKVKRKEKKRKRKNMKIKLILMMIDKVNENTEIKVMIFI